jgi:hypothetical protein
MRRLLLIFLMLLVPFQAAWSMGHAVAGHGSGQATVDGDHLHVDHGDDHHHDFAGPDDMATASAGNMPSHDDGCHHGSHVHPAFNLIVTDSFAGLTYDASGPPPQSRQTAFTSYIPPLFDRPPAARG